MTTLTAPVTTRRAKVGDRVFYRPSVSDEGLGGVTRRDDGGLAPAIVVDYTDDGGLWLTVFGARGDTLIRSARHADAVDAASPFVAYWTETDAQPK